MNRLVSESEYVITMLVNRMIPPERERQAWSAEPEKRRKSGVVFLLGAGCSRQYGLPSFRELLTYIWQDCFYSHPDPSWSFEMLRDQLNKYWQAQGPEARLKLLRHYLGRVEGKICSGYVRLAGLAREGLVKAVVNMNFDTLLEEALRDAGQDFLVSTSFQVEDDGRLQIIKPHGSIGVISRCGGQRESDRPANELILDIANSDLFAAPREQELAQMLLTGSDVVSVGYSGVDAKMAAALRGFTPPADPKDRKLFVINLSRPDPRLLLVMADRASQDLSITGGEAAFENFMEQLWSAVRATLDRKPSPARSRSAAAAEAASLMTTEERTALAECLRLALSIRSAINVADQSSVGIEEHGRQVYGICLDLANAAGVCLTSPEKYLLHCTAYLHDLGYFEAFSGSRIREGIRLLKRHGETSANLLRQRLQDDRELEIRIVPASYVRHRRQFLEILCALCRHHADYQMPGRIEIDDTEVQVAGIPVPVRFDLLQALFSCAELIVNEHPFLPSSDPVVVKNESRWAVRDPVLDLYLRRKKDEVSFTIERGKVIGRFRGQARFSEPSRKAIWLLTMTAESVRKFSRLSCERYRGWGMEFTCSPEQCLPEPRPRESRDQLFIRLLRQALGEELCESLRQVERDAEREAAALLVHAGQVAAGVRPRLAAGPRKDLAEALGIVEHRLGWLGSLLREHWAGDLARNMEFVMKTLQQLQGELREDPAHDCKVLLASLDKGLKHFRDNVPVPVTEQAVTEVRGARELLDRIRDGLGPDLAAEAGELARAGRLLGQFETNLGRDFPGDVATLADLVTIYTRSLNPSEPRVSLEEAAAAESQPEAQAIREVMRRLEAAEAESRLPHHGLLPYYLILKRRRQRSAMEKMFLKSFERRIYPAWRFFARNWNDHIESVLMARACLDLGSSRFDGEVVSGLRHLLEDKVFRKKDRAYGHDQCTLCTSRLLYIFAHARRLFPREELAAFTGACKNRGLDQTVGGLLRQMLDLDADAEGWWGVGAKAAREGCVHSPDYLAWGARSVAFCLAVDHEIRDKTGEEWLGDVCGVPRAEVERLLVERWQRLYGVTEEELLSDRGEEPHSYILGRVALACLDLQWLDERVREKVDFREQAEAFRGQLERACRSLSAAPLAQLSRFYLWPAILFLDHPGRDSQRSGEAVDLCYRCVHSPVWIDGGADAGSWGSNVKNSQAVVTSLAAFWRFAFQRSHREEFQDLFAEREGKPPEDRAPVLRDAFAEAGAMKPAAVPDLLPPPLGGVPLE